MAVAIDWLCWGGMTRVVASYFWGRKTAIKTAANTPSTKHLKRKRLCFAKTIRISSIRNSEDCRPKNFDGSSKRSPEPVSCLLSTGYLLESISHGTLRGQTPNNKKPARNGLLREIGRAHV